MKNTINQTTIGPKNGKMLGFSEKKKKSVAMIVPATNPAKEGRKRPSSVKTNFNIIGTPLIDVIKVGQVEIASTISAL